MKSKALLTGLPKFWMAPLVLFIMIGCSGLKVRLVGEYDDIVDKSVHQIESKTTAHIKQILDNQGGGDGAYGQSKQFYSDIKGEVQACSVSKESGQI